MIWLILILVVLIYLYLHIQKCKMFYKDKGIEPGNTLPFLGDDWKMVFRMENIADYITRTYNREPGKRIYAVCNIGINYVGIKDPDLIKRITVKDFEYFSDRMPFFNAELDPLWSKNLFELTGKKWRDMRTTLSPAFTSSKMKQMFTLIQDMSKSFVQHLEKQNQDVVEVELKDVFTRFTNDVIATTAFGIKVDSLAKRDNTFYLMGKETTNFTSSAFFLKVIILSVLPALGKIFDMRLFNDAVSTFFRTTIKETMEVREKNNIVRPDMINLLMGARKGNHIVHDVNVTDTSFASVDEALALKSKEVKQQLTDDDITAQALIFFLGGFDSVSNLMCFTAYELAVNPDIQDRMRQEVSDTIEDGNGEITYEGVMKMKYLDMVISESLRKWPNDPSIERICIKQYTIEPESSNEKPIIIRKGQPVWIPVYALHRDPKYFENPDKFDPERFNEENKSKINPYAYMPFGAGPRNCIGSRFALLKAKIVLCELLRKFIIVPTEKSDMPLKLKNASFAFVAKRGFNFGFKRI